MTQKSSPRVEAKRKAKKAEILKVALEMVVQEGFDGFSMHKLAKKLDCAVGMTYRYFASKGTLFFELDKAIIIELGALVEDSLVKNATETPLKKIIEVNKAYKGYSQQFPQKFYLLQLFINDPKPLMSQDEVQGILRELDKIIFPYAVVFKSLFDEMGIKLDDPLTHTVAVWASINGILTMRKMNRLYTQVFNVDRLFEECLSNYLLGLGVPRADIEKAFA